MTGLDVLRSFGIAVALVVALGAGWAMLYGFGRGGWWLIERVERWGAERWRERVR